MPVAPKGTNAGQCSTCAAPVLWCRTAKGKAMPLDVEPRADGNIELRPQPPHGRVVAVYIKTTGTLDMLAQPVRFASHFATCPQAKKHRKKKK